MTKKTLLQLLTLGLVLVLLTACSFPDKNNNSAVSQIPEEIIEVKETVSLFSWYFEFTNQYAFHTLSEPLKELGVTRVYQLFPAEYLSAPQVSVMVSNLSALGIETVLLTGDKSWLVDGLEEYYTIIDALSAYNDSVTEALQIRSIALDVEAHTLDEWQNSPKETFRTYVDLMKQAKEYADAHGLQVIQVIPTHYDKVDKKLFTEFLVNCCDELSIMNYEKKKALSAISTEVKLCKRYGIPVETIFETMPLSEEHAVTDEMTYFNSDIAALTGDVTKIKEKYGSDLGIGYHHFSTLYHVYSGSYQAEIFPSEISPADKGTDPTPSIPAQNPGLLLLMGDDGSHIVASPCRTDLRSGADSFCWLALGVKENVAYSVQYYDLFQSRSLPGKLSFEMQENGFRLQATLP